MLGPETMFNYPPNGRNGLLNFDLGPRIKPDHSASVNTRVDNEKILVLMFQTMKKEFRSKYAPTIFSSSRYFIDSNPLLLYPTHKNKFRIYSSDAHFVLCVSLAR